VDGIAGSRLDRFSTDDGARPTRSVVLVAGVVALVALALGLEIARRKAPRV
jgi:hypothetical protein